MKTKKEIVRRMNKELMNTKKMKSDELFNQRLFEDIVGVLILIGGNILVGIILLMNKAFPSLNGEFDGILYYIILIELIVGIIILFSLISYEVKS